jgi:hypothetical protein
VHDVVVPQRPPEETESSALETETGVFGASEDLVDGIAIAAGLEGDAMAFESELPLGTREAGCVATDRVGHMKDAHAQPPSPGGAGAAAGLARRTEIVAPAASVT